MAGGKVQVRQEYRLIQPSTPCKIHYSTPVLHKFDSAPNIGQLLKEMREEGDFEGSRRATVCYRVKFHRRAGNQQNRSVRETLPFALCSLDHSLWLVAARYVSPYSPAAEVKPVPFDHPDWIFELKYDGFRTACIAKKYEARRIVDLILRTSLTK